MKAIAGYVGQSYVVVYAEKHVPTIRPLSEIAKDYKDNAPGWYFIPGKVISNFDDQWLLIRVLDR
jgi:hypothetical protein